MKKLYVTFIALFLAVIIIPAVCVFAGADKSFSDNENRMLQTAPELKASTVLDGTFQEKLTKYISDQFPARDTWTALGTQAKKLAGLKDIGGAYLGKDGYYFEKITPNDINEAKYRANLLMIKNFAELNPDVPAEMLLVPATGTVLSDKLPANARMYDAKAMYDTAVKALPDFSIPDLFSALSARSDEYIYYRTDHHWTTLGAEIAYRSLMGDNAAFKGEASLAAEEFFGTTYSKTLDSAAVADSVYTIPVADGISVTADGKDIEFYNSDAFAEKDKYKIFFGGNYGRVDIKGGTDNGKTLLVIKDSFANSLVPFFTYDYENIIMLDLRYFMGSAKDIMAEKGVDGLLFVCEMSGLASDPNLVKLSF